MDTSSRSVRLSLAAWAAGLAVAAALLIAGPSPAFRGAGLVVVMGLGATAALRREERRWGLLGRASPLSICAVCWFVFLGVAGLGSFHNATHDPRVGFDPANLVRSLAVGVGGLTLLAAGYLLTTATAEPSGDRLGSGRPILIPSVVGCLVVGWACRLLRIQQGSFGYLSYGQTRSGVIQSVLVLGDGLVVLSMAVLAWGLWSNPPDWPPRRTVRNLIVADVPLLAVTALVSGIKGQLVTDLLPVGIIYLLLRGRLPWKAMLVLALYVVVLLSGVEQFRVSIREAKATGTFSRGAVATTAEVTDLVVRSWVAKTPQSHVVGVWHHVTGEYATINLNLASILHQTPHHVPYTGTSRLVRSPIFFRPLPQVGGRPFSIGQYVSVVYMKGPATSSTPPTQPGDLYLSGGWIVVVLGELAWGAVLGLIWRRTLRGHSERWLVLYAVLAALCANAGVDIPSLVRQGLQLSVAYGLALLVMFGAPLIPVGAVPEALGAQGEPVSPKQ